ncbi:DUF45 domain-containing protein [Nonomuraea longispora]|uniref:DUF45 domain-containing protein n=1 Tax=Nonomuraea longispora TaxID=1848320 RepID=A0A4R4NNU9_9ACTN|nr:DUF45 domain-containing protein [Nonomuraea longispora]
MRPRRRTLGIEVSPDGSVLLAVPTDADVKEVAETLLSNVDRVAKAVRRRMEQGAEPPVKELVDGEHFSYSCWCLAWRDWSGSSPSRGKRWGWGMSKK